MTREQQADKLRAMAEWFRDCKTLTLERLPVGLLEALDAGADVLLTAPAPSIEAAITAMITDVAELSDRTSPEDWPDAMLVTADELRRIISDRLLTAPAPAGEEDPPSDSEIDALVADIYAQPE